MNESSFDSVLVIGSRGSDLALAQSRWVASQLEERGTTTRIEIIKTEGDRIQDVPLASMEGKGFFTKELEEALLDRRIDLAVHSLKDLPTISPPGLAVTAVPEREDPRDCLLVQPDAHDATASFFPIKPGTRVGTSSIRRETQLRHGREDLVIVDLRGNVPTRVQKLKERVNEMGAIVLANAGLRRLGLDLGDLLLAVLEPHVFLPAPGQGALGLQTRAGDEPVVAIVKVLEDPGDARRVEAERLLLAKLEGGCHLPLGVSVREESGVLKLTAFLGETERWGAARRVTVTASEPREVAQLAYRALTPADS